MNTSKNPRIGAIYFLPLDTKIMRMVPIETSHMRAMKIRMGSITYVKVSEFKNELSIIVF